MKDKWKATVHMTPYNRVLFARTKRELLDAVGAWSARKIAPGLYQVDGGAGDPDVTIERNA